MSGDDSGEPVLLARHGSVVLISFNRPEVRNALDSRAADLVGAALDSAEDDASVRAVVITGRGPAFCAGGDVRELARGRSKHGSALDRGFAGIVRHPITKPLIAAVNGAARGGGVEIVLACDLAIAAESATFALPEARIGRLPSAGGVFRLPAAVGMKRALAMMFLGDPIDAPTAAEWGLVNRVVPDADVLAAGLDLAARIAASAPLSVAAIKRIAYGMSGVDRRVDADGWTATDRERTVIGGSSDAAEGAQAFLERRPPVWHGR